MSVKEYDRVYKDALAVVARELDRATDSEIDREIYTLAICIREASIRGMTRNANKFGAALMKILAGCGIPVRGIMSPLYVGWNQSSNIDFRRAVNKLSKIRLTFDRPELTSYFKAGIWDIALVERYIADGIDAELALSMVGSDV